MVIFLVLGIVFVLSVISEAQITCIPDLFSIVYEFTDYRLLMVHSRRFGFLLIYNHISQYYISSQTYLKGNSLIN